MKSVNSCGDYRQGEKEGNGGVCVGIAVNQAVVVSLLSLRTHRYIVLKIGGRVRHKSGRRHGECQWS